MTSRSTELSSQLWNCEHAFSNLCPKIWSELKPTDTPGVRFCNACSENVTYCSTPEEFVQLGNAGQCVAIPDGHTPGSLQSMLLGKPSQSNMRALEERQKKTANWWHDVIELKPAFGGDILPEISQLSKMQRLGNEGISEDHRAYLIELKTAIEQGPAALYRLIRIKPNGKRNNQQNIFRVLRYHFALTYRECKSLADQIEGSETT